jgi:GNAT superfamily N-acetyltransferase
MIIERWDAVNYWDDLEELAKSLDHQENIESVFAAKVIVLHCKVRAAVFVVLTDDKKKCVGYFTVKDCEDYAFVHDFVLSPEITSVAGRVAKQIAKFIKDLGFTSVKGKVKAGNDKALRIYKWLGFEPTHYLVTLDLNKIK